jgi:predicted DNA binding CopG/RHH family protein
LSATVKATVPRARNLRPRHNHKPAARCTPLRKARRPAPLLHAIKREANRRDVPYQSLIKVVLAERFTLKP